MKNAFSFCRSFWILTNLCLILDDVVYVPLSPSFNFLGLIINKNLIIIHDIKTYIANSYFSFVI